MSSDVAPYTGLITSEHADKPCFVATVAASVQPLADLLDTLSGLPAAFDLDTAVGAQLDIVGQWVGRSRNVSTALTGVYFSFDTLGLGFDQGVIWGPGDPLTGLIALPDDIYRLVLKAKIAANQWDGTVPGAYTAWNTLFAPEGFQILIQDNGDMTMTLALVGAINNPTFQGLFSGGYLDLRPSGVRITGYLFPSADAPLFGLDVDNAAIAGFDVSAWAVSTPVAPLSTEGGFYLNGGDILIAGSPIRTLY